MRIGILDQGKHAEAKERFLNTYAKPAMMPWPIRLTHMCCGRLV